VLGILGIVLGILGIFFFAIIFGIIAIIFGIIAIAMHSPALGGASLGIGIFDVLLFFILIAMIFSI
jgi:hypothetical protein